LFLRKINRYNTQLSNTGYAEIRATQEISRLFEVIDLPSVCKHRVKERFSEIFPQLQSGSKYKNPEKLTAILIYMVLKSENIVISKKELVNNSLLSQEEFNNFIFYIQKFVPEYKKRDRQGYVAQKLLEITEYFRLDMDFYYISHKILLKLWNSINNTTDDVIAGFCATITTLCNYRDAVNVGSICNHLNINMSTIQFQVQKRIFKRFKIPGFVSLVKSSAFLQRFIERIGILKGYQIEVEIIEDNPDNSENNIVSIHLGGAQQVFNPHNEHYLLGSVDDKKTITLCHLEIFNHDQDNRNPKDKQKKEKVSSFNLTSRVYYIAKGPPISAMT
jgi:hypothetical protein